MKTVTCNLHVDGSQGNHRYDMILRCDIFPKLKIYLYFSDNKIIGNGVVYEGYMSPIKYVTKIILNKSSDCRKEKIFWNKELWEIKHVLDTT